MHAISPITVFLLLQGVLPQCDYCDIHTLHYQDNFQYSTLRTGQQQLLYKVGCGKLISNHHRHAPGYQKEGLAH